MKILAITAGTAGMYCGSCIRDNALAAEWIHQGHEVQLIPLYTPTRTDEPNVSAARVFFGGISIYLEQRFPFFRRAPRFLDRLWDAPWVLRAVSRLAVTTEASELGALTVSMLRGEEGNQRKEFGKLLDWMRTQPKPDIAILPFTLLIRLADPLRQALGCPVCCTLQGEDLFIEALGEPYRSQSLELIRAHVDQVDAYVAVSRHAAEFMGPYLGIPREKIHVVPLGINLQGYPDSPPDARPQSKPFTVGYFARLTPDKGLHVLCQAYRCLRQELGLPPARLEAAGYLGPEYKDYLRGIEDEMKMWGLGDEFAYRGSLNREEKIRFLSGLDVLSVPGPYADPKGLYLLEAMACGVPVVQPRHGAFPEIVDTVKGGILVEPNNSRSLAEGIHSLWKDPDGARDFSRRGFEGVRAHYSVAREAERALRVFEAVAGLRPAPAAV